MTQEFYLILFIVLSLILSYLIGSIPTAKIIASRHGVDITKEGKVVINGSLVVENDIFYPTPQYDSEITYPVLLKEDEYFVLCDQRNGAKDSRIYGTIQKRNTKGKVIILLRKNNI